MFIVKHVVLVSMPSVYVHVLDYLAGHHGIVYHLHTAHSIIASFFRLDYGGLLLSRLLCRFSYHNYNNSVYLVAAGRAVIHLVYVQVGM